MKKKPIIGISTNEIVNFNGRQISHSTGQRYVESVMKFSDVIPILIPSFHLIILSDLAKDPTLI